MTASPDFNLIYLPAQSPDWGGILVQFAAAILTREGRQYAAWAGERLSRAVQESGGVVALTPAGALLGLMLLEISNDSAEMSFPWTASPSPALAEDLTRAAMQIIAEEYPETRFQRVERQLVPGEIDPSGVQAAGFTCHWRLRMSRALTIPLTSLPVPTGYRLLPWNIGFLDAAAEMMFRANEGTLDATLYRPFFGDSPEQCRKGLLTILVGKFGPLLPEATFCVFKDDELAGINLVIDEGDGLAAIVELSVAPEHQRRGLARILMLESLRVLLNENFDRVELAVTCSNAPALALYESLDFTTLDQFPVCIPADAK